MMATHSPVSENPISPPQEQNITDTSSDSEPWTLITQRCFTLDTLHHWQITKIASDTTSNNLATKY